jgi:hypothetical protein
VKRKDHGRNDLQKSALVLLLFKGHEDKEQRSSSAV